MGKSVSVSPLAPAEFPNLPVIDGVEFSTAAAAIRHHERPDVMLARMAPGTTVAGVFTRSSMRSASVLDCQEKIVLHDDSGAAIIVNSGNANAFTGRNGAMAVKSVTKSAAEILGLPESRVFSSSTGVIGEKLPHERINAKLRELSQSLSPHGARNAALAITTTDTFPKGAGKTLEINGNHVNIAGIAKGSGMIAPDMATMLSYVFTDAKISRALLQRKVSEFSKTTFNGITVDGDTSTSDTVLVAATAKSGVEITDDCKEFWDGLHQIMLELAQLIVRDGEGATKFVEVSVSGAISASDARIHALSIANSPLVKTAIAGEDPNWGRIVMAIGKSGALADRDKLTIHIGDILVAAEGWAAPEYVEKDAAEYMKNRDIAIKVDIGLGRERAVVWTCDFTHGYIAINADYRS